jgi:tyrosinase
MASQRITRRDFVKSSLCALAATSVVGPLAFAQTNRTRLEWQAYKTSPYYSSYLGAIASMRRNTNASDPASWNYWVNVHVNYCPHGIAYFLAWHRGYLYYFEQQLRKISGNSELVLPYWSYFSNPNIPAEFTDPASPLYVERVNTNVYGALDLTPFRPEFVNFQRGTSYSFEAQLEYQPHGPVHNIIGGAMVTLQSPTDPIFWLHHAEIDRLWAAWVAAGGGRKMPARTNTYWKGNFTYASGLSIARSRCYDTTTYLGYQYMDRSMPSSYPPESSAARIIRVQSQGGRRQAPGRPPVRDFPPIAARAIEGGGRSIGGVGNLSWNENSFSVQIPVAAADSQALQGILSRSAGGQGAAQYKSANVVLDNVQIGAAGALGGFFYQVYLNLPEGGANDREAHLIGTFGPFEVSAAQHHGNPKLVFSATRALRNAGLQDVQNMTVSFVRVDGKATPKGEALTASEVRVEASADAEPESE